MHSQADWHAQRAFGNSGGIAPGAMDPNRSSEINVRSGDRKPYYETTTGKSAADLMRNYNTSESFLTHLFAEQRSNLLLVAGNHYTGRGSKFFDKMRQIENVSRQQKLRLTKNHIQKITKTYVNNILNYAPTVAIKPKHEESLQSTKAAQLYQSVWDDIKERHKFHKLTRLLARDYVEVGEAVLKVGFDEKQGHFLGYDVHVDDDGIAILNDNEPSYAKAFTGDLFYERILGFNLLSDPDARSWEEVRWVIYRKMVSVDDLRAAFEDDHDKMAQIHESFRQTFKIFDAGTGTYRTGEGLTMLMEHYYRPCAEFPNGYYYICLESTILYEGELPLGLFPICYLGFDEASTSARSFSVIKHLRPYQAEINRCASKIAEHQITLGDDKLLLMNGASLSPGGTAHGVKAIHVTGTDPKIFAGRTGDQYLGYMNSQVTEMYNVASVQEMNAEKDVGQMDPFAALYKSAREKKPFMLYIDKFEEFLKEICELSLRFAKAYYSDEMVVKMVGKAEQVNIDEFRSADDLCYSIICEAATEDLETRMGRQLTLNHMIQYVGPQLARADIGLAMRSMPWMNDKMMFKDLTVDYDNASNVILALDRGKFPAVRDQENHKYMLSKLDARMKAADYEMLPPMVQQAYEARHQQHSQKMAQQLQQAQAAEAGFIPSGGFLTTCDMYAPDPQDPTGRRRVRLPSEAIEWLVKKLGEQGTVQGELQGLSESSQAQVGTMMGHGGQPMPNPGQPGRPQLVPPMAGRGPGGPPPGGGRPMMGRGMPGLGVPNPALAGAG